MRVKILTWALLKLAIVLFIVGLILTGSSTSGIAKKVGGDLRVAVQADPGTLDPHDVSDVPSRTYPQHFGDTLIFCDVENKLYPGLATSWAAAENGLSYTFKLRKGVKFHDGTDFNAQAVKINLERIIDPKNALKNLSEYADLDHVEVIDNYTCKMVMKNKSGVFINLLATTGATMISPTALNKWGKEIKLHPVGTGPFKFEEWIPKNRIVMTANSDYWGGKPSLDRIIFKPAPEDSTRVAMLEAGDVDAITNVPLQDFVRLKNNPMITPMYVKGNDNLFFFFNMLHKPFKDIRVRHAFNYAIDREAIVKNIYKGYAKPLNDSPVGMSMFGYAPVGTYYSYNPEKAKQLLKEAGYEKGLKVKMWVSDGRYLMDRMVGEAVAGYLNEIGVEVDLSKYEWGTYLGKILNAKSDPPPEYDLLILTFSSSAGDIDGAVQPTLMSTGWPPKHYNWAFYANPEVDRLIMSGRTTVDMEKRKEIYKELQKIVMEDAPWLFVVNYFYTTACRENVGGVVVLPRGMIDIRNAYFK